MILKKLPIGLQSFRKIAEGDYVYADKTQYIYSLLNEAGYYFMSRPRRFGKSLLLDTIAEVFGGDKELFKGLYIYDSDYDFEKHPVIRLDMSNIANKTPETLENSLLYALKQRAKTEGFEFSSAFPSDIFKSLIEGLYEKYNKKVVALIDEYDKPILDHLTNISVAESNRDVLRGFYGILKSMDPYLKFTFITGVTKFTKTSIFSGLNNLRDITMAKKYANICGIATEDLGKYFGGHLEYISSLDEFARYGSIGDAILSWYDGYSWDGSNRVINPFSLLSFFCEERFSGYWYASGTPSFLIKLLKTRPESFLSLKNFEIRERVLDTFDIHKIEIEPLLFQTGYLTVKEKRFHEGPESYILDIPNIEVKESFYLNIIAEFTEKGETFAENAYIRIKEALQTGNLQNILNILKSLFSSIPYELHIDREAYYHSVFYAVMSVLGFEIDAEVSVSGGRIDAVLELADKVYIMEFKYANCPKDTAPEVKNELFKTTLDDGIKQIYDRGYANKYENSGKKIYKAAFAFLGRAEIEMRLG